MHIWTIRDENQFLPKDLDRHRPECQGRPDLGDPRLPGCWRTALQTNRHRRVRARHLLEEQTLSAATTSTSPNIVHPPTAVVGEGCHQPAAPRYASTTGPTTQACPASMASVTWSTRPR